MNGIEKIHDLMDQIADEIMKVFPDASNAGFRVCCDGYRSICVEKWEENEEVPVKDRKRKELFEQSKLRTDGKWSEDISEIQNAYYRDRSILLEV